MENLKIWNWKVFKWCLEIKIWEVLRIFWQSKHALSPRLSQTEIGNSSDKNIKMKTIEEIYNQIKLKYRVCYSASN